ncbi:hypothetical protein G6F63_016291 [Rhizopus arrhizus]|nr:hypothetical protein G6F63_016291 [Rhizopus arrhizus]
MLTKVVAKSLIRGAEPAVLAGRHVRIPVRACQGDGNSSPMRGCRGWVESTVRRLLSDQALEKSRAPRANRLTVDSTDNRLHPGIVRRSR